MTEFEKLVMQMRDAQKSYFRTRDAMALQAAKRLEWQVDAFLAGIEKKTRESAQMELDFGGEK